MIYFFRKTATSFQGWGNDSSALPWPPQWTCSPAARKLCTVVSLWVFHPNQILTTRGKPVTSTIIAFVTSMRIPLTFECMSVKLRVNYKVVSVWKTFRHWKYSVHPATSKMEITFAFLCRSPVFVGSCQAGISILPLLLGSDIESGNYRSMSGSYSTRMFNE